jgi:hypothetical protein
MGDVGVTEATEKRSMTRVGAAAALMTMTTNRSVFMLDDRATPVPRVRSPSC